jgi:hypothetical protein
VSNLDPERIRADIGRWKREIQTSRNRFKLTDDHPEITRRIVRIQAAERLLAQRDDDCAGCGGQGCHECDDWAASDTETNPSGGAS